MRVVIELRRGEIPDIILNNLYKLTQLQDSFGMNMVALVDNQPRLLNLKQFIEHFIAHRREVVVRRTRYQLTKARERGHVLEGLAVALSNVDEIIALIKPARVTAIVATELKSIRDQFGDKRRSEIVAQGVDLSIEDLIAPEDMVVTLSHGGYMKAQPVAEYRAQRRGGRGKQATGTKEDDFIDHLFIANTHDHILCFSNRGRVYWLKVYNVPQGGRIARGKPIVNLVPLLEHEKITAILPVKEFVDDHFVFMATAHGTVKKTPLSEFSRPRPSGIIAIDLDDGDFLVGAALTDGKHDVMLFSSGGKAVRFEDGDV